jgi:hypothetical protein
MKEQQRKGKAKPDSDKWYHCVTSCEITRECGAEVAEWLGDLKEKRSKDSKDSAKDQKANKDGRDCGGDIFCGEEKPSCEACCEAKGYSR